MIAGRRSRWSCFAGSFEALSSDHAVYGWQRSAGHLISGFAALVVLLVASSAGARPVYLVAVGNNVGFPDEPELRYAERDARELTSALQQLGGVAAARTVLALGEDAGAVRGTIAGMNARIRTAMAAGQADTVLLVYYSGHADATGLHLGRSAFPFEELRNLVAGSAATVRVLVLDSCRSGGATQVKGGVPEEEFAIRLEQRGGVEGMAVITSSAAGEDSHESDRLRGSFFSHHLVNGLRGAADRNADGQVTLHEVYDYAYRQTLRSSGRTISLQHPTYRYDIKGRGELVLTRVGGKPESSARLDLPGPDLYLVMEDEEDGDVVAEVMAGEDGVHLLLPPGHYFVQRRARDSYREYQVSVARGQVVDFSRVAYRTVAYSRLVRKGGGERRAIHGVYLLGGVRGEILPGQGYFPHYVLGYTADLPWLSVGVRARLASVGMRADDDVGKTRHWEFGLGLTVQRYFDVSIVSFSVGLLVEAVHHRQSFTSTGSGKDRASWGATFGGLFTVELELAPDVLLRLEGGPLTHVFRRGNTRAGVEVGASIESPFTWWAAAGFVWRI